jgi:multisubunit Na+/H+ antiporter MnhB subunit
MYSGLSFGFLLLALALVVNIFRTPSISFEQTMPPLISIVLRLAAFRRAVSFRKWRYREILLSFYHLAVGEQQNPK